MRHLKRFESYDTKRQMWLVPTDDRYRPALEEIGCDSDTILNMSVEDRNFSHPTGYIFILEWEPEYEGDQHWGWAYYEGEMKPPEKLVRDGYKFNGTVKIEDYELDAKKYNL